MFGRTSSGEITLRAKKATLGQLAGALSSQLGAPIVDGTGIEGQFDVSLEYTPDQPEFTKSGMPIAQPPDTARRLDIYGAAGKAWAEARRAEGAGRGDRD